MSYQFNAVGPRLRVVLVALLLVLLFLTMLLMMPLHRQATPTSPPTHAVIVVPLADNIDGSGTGGGGHPIPPN
jgi:hypothetical protein